MTIFSRPIVLAVVFLVIAASASGAAEIPSAKDYRSANALFAARKYQEALVLYKKALVAPPQQVPAGDIHARIGDSYFNLGNFRGALESYRLAMQDKNTTDRAQTQYWVGFCCYLTGRDSEAVTELLKVPSQYPQAAGWGTTAYYWAGRASERMGKKEQAAEYYKKAGGNGKTTQARFAQKKADSVNKK